MHSSIGTGSLAYAVGSRVMDMRTVSKDDKKGEAEVKSERASSADSSKLDNYYDWNNNCTDTSFACERESSSDSADLVSVRASTDSAAYDSSYLIPTSGPYNCNSPKTGSEEHGSPYVTETYFDFPAMPVIDLFEKSAEERKEFGVFDDDSMHSFQINNNVDLIMESNGSSSNNFSHPINSEIEMIHSEAAERVWQSKNPDFKNPDFKKEMVNRLRISDVPETPILNATTSGAASEDRVSEWLWTLHRIGRSVPLCPF